MFSNCGDGEDSWESLDSKEIKQINPKRNQPWIFIGRTDAEAEAPILWPPDAKSQFTGKDPDAGKDWEQEEKWMRWLDSITDWMDMNLGRLPETVENREGWWATVHGVSESDMIEWLNWTDVNFVSFLEIISQIAKLMYNLIGW